MKPLTRSRPVRGALVAASAMVALTASLCTPAATASTRTIHRSPATRPIARTPGLTLDQLPGALWRGQATRAPLTIALPAGSSDALRAAILTAGAAQRAAGAHGLGVHVLENPSAGALAQVRGPLVIIDERPGAASLALSWRAHGAVTLTIAGSGAGLLTAARLLSDPAIHAFTSRFAGVPAGLVKAVTRDPAPASVQVAPATISGQGSLSLTTQFTLPLDRVLTGDSSLRLLAGYDAAGGGRLSARLQGGVLGAAQLRGGAIARTELSSKLSDDPALTGDTLPGWWAHPGANQITLTASPTRRGTPGTLQVLSGSRVSLQTAPRAAALQLGLWPFPIYGEHAWSRATVVLDAHAGPATLAALIGALANTERITGITPDPAVALGAPSAEQASGGLIFVGASARAAGAGQIAGLRGLHATQTPLPGTLEEVRLPSGSVALLADGAQSLSALGAHYTLGSVSGRAALVDAYGGAHALAAGQPIQTFAHPRLPWLAPLAFVALLALGWIGLRTVRAQRRVAGMRAFEVGESGGGA